MTTKHTPGPWTTTGPNVRADNGALVATAQDHWNDHKTPQEEKEANAQLISAAPELLEALEEVTTELGWMGNGPRDSDREAFARRVKELRGLSLTAIAKAEGTPS